MRRAGTNPRQDYVPRPVPDMQLYRVGNMEEIPRSTRYRLTADGREVFVYHADFFDYAIVVSDADRLAVEVSVQVPFSAYVLRPLEREGMAVRDGQTLRFELDVSQRAVLELDGDLETPLYVLTQRPVEKPADTTVLFEKGHVYNVDYMELHAGDVVYLEEGAFVCGAFYAKDADDLTILGNGILCGSVWHRRHENGGPQLMVPIHCRNIGIRGITLVDGGSWHIVPVGCTGVRIRDVNILGQIITGDGLDIVGCEDVSVERCFIRANDDCISIKAERYHDPSGAADVHGVSVRDCLFWNAEFGNTLEIGYETACDEISDVVFENCTVLHCQYEGNQSGGVLTIHDADRARVHDITYRDITIEDAQEKFIDIKVLDSKYSSDHTRGKVYDITFENIHVTGGDFPVSIVRGYEMKEELSRPDRICFRNVSVLGQRMTDFHDLHMVVELTDDVVFE